MKNRIIIAAVVLAIGIVGVLVVMANQKAPVSTPQESMSPSQIPTEAPTTIPSTSSAEVDGASESAKAQLTKEITVDGSSFKFVPSTLTVSKGDKVKIIFKNTSGIHDFVIDELGIKTPVLQSGNQAEVEFTADKIGEFEYYCSVGNHRAMGMKGTLVVK